MGENPKKYHVTDEGDVYRVNEDGSFTSTGNAEQRIATIKEEYLNDGHYTVVLESAGNQKLRVVKTISEITNISLKAAKNKVDNPPSILIEDISQVNAFQIRSEFEKIGADISIYLYTSSNTLDKDNNLTISNTLKKNTNSVNQGPNLVSSSQKKGGCTLGIVLLFLISILTMLIT